MRFESESGVHLAACCSAFPPHVVDQEITTRGLCQLFPEESPAFVRGLVARSGVETRRMAPSVAEILSPTDFTARNERYRGAALELALEACRKALAASRTDPERIDVLLDVSCTGISIPALDVALAPELGLRPDVLRVPVTESGCAAGALALGMAGTFADAGSAVLVTAVELCSLTLCGGDSSRTNLVSAAIFGDGAAAALLLPGGTGPRLVASGSFLIPGSRETMGFDVGTHGLRIVLQRELPDLVSRELRPVVERFLAQHGSSLARVGLYLLHPGGRRILEAYRDELSVDEHALRFSRESLRRYGNLSSVSILTVIELALAEGFALGPDEHALVMAIGSGLSLELGLLAGGERA